MAEFGANYPCFKAAEAVSGVVLGKLVSANLTVNLASGELFADDAIAESVAEFSSGSLAMETDDLVDANVALVFGATISGGAIVFNKDDTPPEGKLAYYKVLLRNGVKYYKAFYYPRVKAQLGNDNAQTRGSSITFQTANITFTVMTDDNGDWRKTKTFESAADAETWINTQCTITS